MCQDEHDRQRLIAEVFATDSYQNILFSLIAFRSRFGRWPQHVTVVSHEFKKQRFIEEHRKAIRWPADKLTFIGHNPPEDVTPNAALDLSEAGNRACWIDDLYGANGQLARKRRNRGWRDAASLEAMEASRCYHFEPEIRQLLEYDGGDDPRSIFRDRLPWDHGPTETEPDETTNGITKLERCG